MRRAHLLRIAIALLLALTFAPAAQAQTFSNADLAGVWNVFQLTAPPGVLTGANVSSYSGQVTFDANGFVDADSSVIVSNQVDGPTYFVISGNFSVSVGGVVTGKLLLNNFDGPNTTLDVREARLLANRFTIVGASRIAGQIGLFTFAKQTDGQTFGIVDIGGESTRDWNYNELRPSDQAVLSFPEGAVWVNGVITFHGLDDNPGCSEADLLRSDGSVLSQTRGTGDFSFG